MFIQNFHFFWVCSMWVKMILHSCLQVLSRLPILIAWLSKQPGKVFVSTLRQKILYPSKALQLLRPSNLHSYQSSSYDRQVFIITMLSEAPPIMVTMLVMIMTIGEPQVRSQRWPQPCLNPWQPCRSADHLDFRSTCFLVGFFLCPRPEHHL